MHSRRSFLKLAGFTIAGGAIVGCAPSKVDRAIPMLIKPEEITPGLATWYATTCSGCAAACGMLAKNRDGRPIKMEGNPDHPLSRGGLCAIGQAMTLSLYDSKRLSGPLVHGESESWETVDATIKGRLETIAREGGAIRILTGTVNSPTQRAVIAKFLSRYPTAAHVEYDALSSSAIREAHLMTHDEWTLPHYQFQKARVIASFDADFLGTWISPVEFTRDYRAGRDLEHAPDAFSYHVQFEPRLSLTGGKADRRVCASPAQLLSLLDRLHQRLNSDVAGAGDAASRPELDIMLGDLPDRLWKAGSSGLVVCGSNDVAAQLLVNRINVILRAYGSTIDLDRPSFQRCGDDRAVNLLVEDVFAGRVHALIVFDTNPVYSLGIPDLADAIQKIPLVVSCAERIDETAAVAGFVCPVPHGLEQWNDAEPVAGVISVAQPTIAPLVYARPFIESLSAWIGGWTSSLELMQEEWKRSIFPRRLNSADFQQFWDTAVEEGVVEVNPIAPRVHTTRAPMTEAALQPHAVVEGSFAFVTYAKPAMLDGRHAHNPWLQELPDPVSKIVWDNYAIVSLSTAQRLGLVEGDVVRITVPASAALVELPVHVQPGTHEDVIAVALGYGRKGTERFTTIGPQWLESKPTVQPNELVGRNVAGFVRYSAGAYSSSATRVTIAKTGAQRSLSCTQEYHSLHDPAHLSPAGAEARPIIQETTLAAWSINNEAGRFEESELESMWPAVPIAQHKWGMAIDLTACTGCGACVIGCQSENNIPVVGKDEVGRNREMQWLRIDRYFEGEEDSIVMAHQPMMCQQCGNAPCETVCPVLATVHSEEGLNQQVYNRCVGTRYCANNCPYKVRHFNWFDYAHDDPMERLALNPDVTVRERGVMEKCSFCVQRIQEARIEAKSNGLPIRDGEILPACMQSCPAQAITFGDMNDPQSKLSVQMRNPRHYHVLEELGVRPSVGYLTLVRNAASKEEHHV